MIKNIPGIFSTAIGIDLGTANVLVYVKGRGIIMNEPSFVAIDTKTRRPIAIGEDAKRMADLVPEGIEIVRPMKNGVIADFEVSEHMLRYFIRKAGQHSFLTHLTVVIAVPFGITPVEERAVKDSAYRAGAQHVQTIPEPIASALGAGLPVGESETSMIVDIGGGTSEIAVLSLGGIVAAKSIRVGGDEFDKSIVNYVKNSYGLVIASKTAEQVKLQIGSAYPLDQELSFEIRGRDSISGMPRAQTINSTEVREALKHNFDDILEGISKTLEICPPESAGQLLDRGAVLAGGGAQIRGLDRFLSDKTGIPFFVAEDPLRCVVNGTGTIIENANWNTFRR
ncbi:MAG: rod shape-determining protein [Candidatus Spyradosoma sp.]